jgi:hypothetical protein
MRQVAEWRLLSGVESMRETAINGGASFGKRRSRSSAFRGSHRTSVVRRA